MRILCWSDAVLQESSMLMSKTWKEIMKKYKFKWEHKGRDSLQENALLKIWHDPNIWVTEPIWAVEVLYLEVFELIFQKRKA